MRNPTGRIKDELSVLLASDTIKLCYPNLPTQKDRINLNYFHPEYAKAQKNTEDSGLRNLGDGMSPVVVEYMLQREGLSLNAEVSQTKHLYAIGSILFMGYQNATVWGSGLLREPSMMRRCLHARMFRKLDIRCVRGPHTRRVLKSIGHDCPEIYGDPGCLMPLIYQPPKEKKIDFLIIPHVSMEEKIRDQIPTENIVSMATDDHKTVMDKICSAKKVISSSLHGIIFSEAYNIPTVFYQDRESRYNFKYADWYESTGRKNWRVETDIKAAIDADPMPEANISVLQEALIESFPYDLW